MSLNKQLFDFIESSPTAFQTVDTVKGALLSEGYTELYEGEEWSLSEGGKYFVIRNGSSLIAFRYNSSLKSFMICATHSDSPSFRLKLSYEKGSKYTVCDTEKYGGMLYYSWLDRPLSLAGRVAVKKENGIETRLVNIKRDLFVIPSVAIHLNREVNSSLVLNPARDLLPLAGMKKPSGLMELIADEAGVRAENIVSHDLFLYVRESGRTFGVSDEFISSPRLDDLECVFASLKAFLKADATDNVPVMAIFDNEEVGSETKQGAASTFLFDTLSAIANGKLRIMLANSFMVSADNAHALHPLHPELSDAENAPLLNGGVVIKYNANQRYATDGVSAAIFSDIAASAGAKIQRYSNRADIVGGSTLGSISDTRVSIMTADVGLAQLAMHSAVESAGAEDLCEMVKALTAFYSSYLDKKGENIRILK